MAVILNRKRITAALAIAVMLTFSIPALADPLSTQLRQQQNELQQARNTYDNLESQITAARSIVQKMDNQIQDIMYTIGQTNDKIDKTNKDITATEESIKKAVDDLNKEQELYSKRIKAMYINGAEGYIGILIGSKSFYDLIWRLENTARIIEYDNNALKELKQKQDEVAEKKETLSEQKNELVNLQQDNQKKLAELNAKKDEQVSLVASLKEKEKTYAANISETQAEVNATLKQLQEIRKKKSQASSSKKSVKLASRDSSTSASGEYIIAYASKFLGVPYVWGGNTPSGFDCSGFTKYVFGHFGISLHRRASEQALQGKAVPLDQLQPGDLVFFGNPVYHVGIYVGNGCFIHAPETGDVVKVSSLKWMDLTRARRLR